MSRRRVPRVLAALVLLPALPHHAGGWAVITVRELPDHAVAGRPLDLTYVVRQHGTHRLPGLQGRVVARAGAHAVSAPATAVRSDGRYAARLTLPRAGEWTITIHSGFRESHVVLPPLRVVAPGTAAPPALADDERGRRLFVATGCASCHTHAASGVAGVAVGPDLTDRRYPPDQLARFLADPSGNAPRAGGAPGWRMPDLDLAPREIAALVAFLNAERRVSRR